MARFDVFLIGGFKVLRGNQHPVKIYATKSRELFAYLLLHRGRSFHREMLCNLLWEECSTAQAQKGLRQALWNLHAALKDDDPSLPDMVIRCDGDRIRIDPDASIWVDVAFVQETYALVQNVSGQQLTGDLVEVLRQAVDACSGELLEDWSQDWLTFERQHLQDIMLELLYKLMVHCDSWREFETGIGYGARILSLDRAHERTHRRLMRMLYSMDDRTAALRQFGRCAAALREELDVRPAKTTIALYEQIKTEEGLEIPVDPGFRLGSGPLEPTQGDLAGVFRMFQPMLIDFLAQLDKQRRRA